MSSHNDVPTNGDNSNKQPQFYVLYSTVPQQVTPQSSNIRLLMRHNSAPQNRSTCIHNGHNNNSNSQTPQSIPHQSLFAGTTSCSQLHVNKSAISAPQRTLFPTVSTTCTSKPVVLLTQRTLCSNCGVTSANASVCSRCKKPTVKIMKQVLQPQQTQTRAVSQSCSSFYGRGGLDDFNRYLQVDKDNMKRPVTRKMTRKAECIMISDSSDEDLSKPTANEGSSQNCQVNHIEESVNGETPQKRARTENLVDEHWLYQYLNVQVNSVRIGQMHVTPTTWLRISGSDMQMSLPNHIFRLKWFAVEKLELSSNPKEPCIYVTVVNQCLATLRSELGMVPGKSPYYDPNGPDDQKFMIFYITQSWFQENSTSFPGKLHYFRQKLKKPLSFFKEITIVESNSRQERVATAACILQSAPPTPTSTPTSTPTDVSSPTLTPAHAATCQVRTRSHCSNNERPHDEEDICLTFNGPRVQLAIYPPPPATGGITIANEDEFCLNEGEFLNDVIIDFYLKYTMQEIISKHDRDRSHVFSCFFYKRLTQQLQGRLRMQEDKKLSAAERRHVRVRKWTRGVDLFAKDFIFIPINDASHWYLAVICFPGKPNNGGVLSSDGAIDNLVVSNIRSLHIANSNYNNASDDTRSKNEAKPVEGDKVVSTCVEIIVNQTISNVEETSDDPTGADESMDKKPDNSSGVKCEKNATLITNEAVDGANEPTVVELSESRQDSSVKQSDLTDILESSPKKNTTSSSDKSNDMNQSNKSMYTVPRPSSVEQFPCILIFDSLRGVSRSRTATNLRDYLTEEWKFRKSKEFGDKVFDSTGMRMCSPHVPQQDNYSDCGVFLLHYVEKMFECPIQDFNLPIRSLQNWFGAEECKAKRLKIREIIQTLHKMQST